MLVSLAAFVPFVKIGEVFSNLRKFNFWMDKLMVIVKSLARSILASFDKISRNITVRIWRHNAYYSTRYEYQSSILFSPQLISNAVITEINSIWKRKILSKVLILFHVSSFMKFYFEYGRRLFWKRKILWYQNFDRTSC